MQIIKEKLEIEDTLKKKVIDKDEAISLASDCIILKHEELKIKIDQLVHFRGQSTVFYLKFFILHETFA